MSGVDDRIREELRALARPVGTAGVARRVAGRKVRLRRARRIRVAGLSLAVAAGTIAGAMGLYRVFRSSESTPAGIPSPASEAPPAGARCDLSTARGDLDGDGAEDHVAVWWPAEACNPEAADRSYWVQVELGGGMRSVRFLSACRFGFGCAVLGTPDLDGDGRDEVVIRQVFGASTERLALFRFDQAAGSLVRLVVAPPGDPWHRAYGVNPGPSAFLIGGSVTHIHTLGCEGIGEEQLVVARTALRTYERPDEPHSYDLHVTRFRLAGHTLSVVEAEDRVIEEGETPEAYVESLCEAQLVRP